MAPSNSASPGGRPSGGGHADDQVRGPVHLPVTAGPPSGGEGHEVAIRHLSCDLVLTAPITLADAAIPVAKWDQQECIATSLESRALTPRALRKPPPGIGTDLAVSAESVSRLGITDGGSASIGGVRFASEPHAVSEELRRATAGGVVDDAGVTWERVDAEDGVVRQSPPVDRAGTLRLFGEDLPTSYGRVRVSAEHRPVAAESTLPAGRMLSHSPYRGGPRPVAGLRAPHTTTHATTCYGSITVWPSTSYRVGVGA